MRTAWGPGWMDHSTLITVAWNLGQSPTSLPVGIAVSVLVSIREKKNCGDAYLILYITILSLSVEKNDINCVSLINIRALLWLNLYPHPLCGLAFALLATPHC